jgi:CubicO group peptidase (beta-lactamase class C family)
MKFKKLEREITEKILQAIDQVTPGVQLCAYLQGKKVLHVEVGKTYPYYDLASLTKVIFTVPALMRAFDQGLWHMDSKVVDFVPWFQSKNALIKDVLSHSAGLVWWLPLYEKLPLKEEPLVKWFKAAEMIRQSPVKKTSQCVYSDVDSWVLGFVLEGIYHLPLQEIWDRLKERFFPRSTFNFHFLNHPVFKTTLYAPTENCPWRKKLLQGEVHDDNAWSLGGVSTHAGLFGSLDDLTWYGLFLRSHVVNGSELLLKPRTVKMFTSRAVRPEQGDWGLGFMKPSVGKASCGKHFSLASFGHTGFTGTSIWFDPKKDLLVSILSNRVLYGRDNKSFANLRPTLHDWIVEGLKRV